MIKKISKSYVLMFALFFSNVGAAGGTDLEERTIDKALKILQKIETLESDEFASLLADKKDIVSFLRANVTDNQKLVKIEKAATRNITVRRKKYFGRMISKAAKYNLVWKNIKFERFQKGKILQELADKAIDGRLYVSHNGQLFKFDVGSFIDNDGVKLTILKGLSRVRQSK